jgi:hypothetical protein
LPCDSARRRVRIAAALGTLATVTLYLIAQLVGGGGLIRLMFGFSYEHAIILVGIVMIGYVLFGGMIATTWVQIVKAVLLMTGALLLALLVLLRFGMSPAALFAAAAERYGDDVLAPGKLVSNPLEAVSLGMALMFGTAGVPPAVCSPAYLSPLRSVPALRTAPTMPKLESSVTGSIRIWLSWRKAGAESTETTKESRSGISSLACECIWGFCRSFRRTSVNSEQ